MMQKLLRYTIRGIGYGSFAYLLTLLLFHIQIRPTVASTLSVWLISAGIGWLSFLFESDRLPFWLIILLHCLGTLGLITLMMLYNGWSCDLRYLGIFAVIYAIVWVVVRLNQHLKVTEINQALAHRRAQQ
ncbi:DUF3021 domain-containing protein [Loigolactobacillus bifermentans]|jgi:lysylphosphatidylglycerol synthetase-like protein (DUF2156 family)|uniref:DUF3021 domain-containing protein n=1 Tax=Loigolactobacillus bifermentans DSM 20003 TaxID=1423726 RepID=A0A0R1GRZ5_9LACO|nr:DUF3021 domain-containing protein [Loigolactobacillus bifermentans]KRK34516.1 hypothetical protein FC07_GL000527 [Loigolactobacillus bifermentans DSM 20003]QGG61291.1 DUF3021 family protein [Loigolactobacillus bifermentans]